MADVTAKALIKVDADTSGAVRETNKLTEAQKGLGKALEAGSVSVGQFVLKAANGFATFNLAVGGVQKAMQLLNGALDTAASVQRQAAMEKLLPTGTVDKFREATDRMISRQDVLRVSVKGMTGDFKLSETQMQKVLSASLALQQKGFGDAAQIADRLTDALAKGVNKLDDFGINLEKTGDRQHDVNEAMKKFDALIGETPIDEQSKKLAQLKDNLLLIANAISSVVAAAAAGLSRLVSDMTEYGPEFLQWITPGGREADHNIRMANKRRARAEAGMDAAAAGDAFYRDVSGAGERGMIESNARYMGDDSYARELMGLMGTSGTGAINLGPVKRGTGRGGDTTGLGGTRGGVLVGRNGDRGDSYAGTGMGGSNFGGVSAPGRDYANASGMSPRGSYDMGIDANSQGGLFLGTFDKNDPAGSMGTALAQQSEFAAAGWNVFTDSFAAGVSAVIDGSESMGKAFQRTAAAGLKALATEYAVRALGFGAWSIAALAMGDFKGAAGFAASALQFAAAAAAAGVGSHLLGGGGGGGAGASAGAAGGGYAPRPQGGRGGGDGATNIVINLGDGFYGDTNKIEQAVSRGIRSAQMRGQRSGSFATVVGGG